MECAKLMTWFLNQVMDHEAEQQSGAGRYVRGRGRRAHRNGHRERTLGTRHGLLQLSKPQLREFPFRTKVFETYSRVENALTSVIMESYIRGVATRDVRSIVEQLGVENISPSTVSRMAKELDVAVHQFLDRPIDDEIAFLIVDASYFKVRDETRYVSKALSVVAGIRADGYREILGANISPAKMAKIRTAFPRTAGERVPIGMLGGIIIGNGRAGRSSLGSKLLEKMRKHPTPNSSLQTRHDLFSIDTGIRSLMFHEGIFILDVQSRVEYRCLS